VAALLFPILQATTLGWRGLYFIGILPLLLIAYMRRSLPETERWQRAHTAGETRHLAFSELVAPAYRLRFVVLIAVSIAAYAAASPAFAFASWRVTRDFGWTPSQVSTMVILGGGVGMLGWFVFGSLAERFGRRPVGIAALVGCGGAIFAYFQSAWPGPAFGALVFMEAGAAVAVNALGTELFPTRMRSTAKSWIINATVVGALLGLLVVGAVADDLGGADRVLALLSILPAAVSPALLLLPETSGRELEELA
jgi:putative MFS transporter